MKKNGVEERAKDTADTEKEDWAREGREMEGRVERSDAESNESLRQFFQRGARALEFLVTSFFFLFPIFLINYRY